MLDRFPPTRRRLVIAAVSIVSAFASAAPVAAAATPTRLYACATERHGTLNLTTREGRCPKGQKKVTWSVEGLRGKAGAKGEDGNKGDAGAKGDQGAAGAPGAKGEAGATGPAGSPDSAGDVLAKLLTVDGAGSGLDAALLGGLPAAHFQQRVTGTCVAGSYVRAIAADGTVTCETTNAGLRTPLTLAGTNTDSALKVTHPNTSGQRAIDVSHSGVGPGVFANTVGGNSLWGVTGSVSAAAVIGDSSTGEAVVARQNGAVCENNIGRCNGIGALVGRHDGWGGYGVRGFVTDPNGAIGVLGQVGISGGTGTAVRGENVNAANGGNAVEAVTNGSGSALFAQGAQAATLNGDVTINGDLTVTGTKSGFRIDDPRAPAQRTLTHTPVETDAMTVTYSGNVRTDSRGRATVRLPEYAETLAADWRYQLTPIGKFGQAIVEHEVRDGRFVIRTEHGDTKVSWNVVGVRRDPQARRDAIDPVADKRGDDRGRYLDPTLYGQPESRSSVERVRPEAAAPSGASAASGERPVLASER